MTQEWRWGDTARTQKRRGFSARRDSNGYTDVYVAGYNQTLMLIDAGDSEAAIGVAAELLAQGLKHAELYSLVARVYANTNTHQGGVRRASGSHAARPDGRGTLHRPGDALPRDTRTTTSRWRLSTSG